MGKFIKVSRDDLFNKVRQSLSGYEVSGDSQNRLMTSVYHLVSYMEKEHLSDYTPDVGVSYLSTINVDKRIAYRHYQRDKRAEDIYWEDGSYKEVSESKATKVSYHEYGNHSAVKEGGEWYRSKWGSFFLIRHKLNEVFHGDAFLDLGNTANYHPELPKKFYKRNYRITGSPVVCVSNTFLIPEIPSDCSTSWSIDNSRFSISPSGNQCNVTYTPSPSIYETANLTAIITKGSQIQDTVIKRIVMHDPDLFVLGYQPEAYVPDGYCPQNSFTITDDDLSLRSFDHQGMDSLLAEERSLPIVFVEEDEPRLIPELGVPNIYGGNNVTLTSTRFDSMDISFSGTTSPEYYNRSGNSIVFRMPTNINTYSVTVNGSGGEGCHDFSFRMNVIPPHGMTSNDPNIFLSLSGTTLSITFEGGIYFAGNGQIGYDPWNVAIYEVPSLGPPVYSAAVPGNQTTINVNTSSWSSGYYLIRVTQNGNVYTKKIFY